MRERVLANPMCPASGVRSAFSRENVRGKPGSVVDDFQDQGIRNPARGDRDLSALGPRRDGVLDGVFHQRLQHERRNGRPRDVRVDLNGKLESIPQSLSLDLDVTLDQVQLLVQRYELALFLLQCRAQQIPKRRKRPQGARVSWLRIKPPIECSVLNRKCGRI